MKKIGILGGTFDPIHNAHLEIAQTVREALQLDAIWFLPDGNPPHKQTLASAEDRLQMVQLAIADIAGFLAIDIEVKRQGTTYTLDTLRELRKSYPDAAFTYIIGADAFERLERWRGFAEIAASCSIAVVGRGATQDVQLQEKVNRMFLAHGTCIWIIPDFESSLSSSALRWEIARGNDISSLVPQPVQDYIRDKQLYADERLLRLRAKLTQKRYAHTLGVEKTAAELARLYGADPVKAAEAALFHDCAKCAYSTEEMLILCKEAGMDIAPDEEGIPQILHAPAGAVLAEREYGICDPEILSAIRWHTTGHAGMTTLEKVVFLADAIEPGRKPYPGLRRIRELAQTDLDAAICLSAQDTQRYVTQRGLPLNPNTERMLNQLLHNGGTEQC